MADRLVPFPFADFPRTEAAVKERFPEQAPKVGRLPWLIQESYAKLVEAFHSGDKARILAESDTLGGYVADMSNPLALTDNARRPEDRAARPVGPLHHQAARGHGQAAEGWARRPRASSTTPRGTCSR